MAWDPAEYHLFAMVHGIEFVHGIELDNEWIIKFCIFNNVQCFRMSCVSVHRVMVIQFLE